MPTLFLKCRSCGEEFPTPIALTDAGRQGMILITGMNHRCPKCGVEDQFSTADYFVPKKAPELDGKESPATIDGDEQADEKAELESEATRLAGLGVEGASQSKKSEGPPPAGDTPAGGS
jgi:hypothetical protein